MKTAFLFVRSAVSVALAVPLLMQSQTAKETQTPSWGLEAEVKTDKTSYAVGEPVHFTATLTNVGDSVVYVAKTFFERGGGIAGFGLTVEQLSGKRVSGPWCAWAADRGLLQDSRTAKQIQEEDFLRLPPGGIVGYRVNITVA